MSLFPPAGRQWQGLALEKVTVLPVAEFVKEIFAGEIFWGALQHRD
jgi:hypothetical protein